MSLYLVTGGAGFIGSNIVDRLVRNKEKVKVIDNFSTGSKENLKGLLDKIELTEGDIRDLELMEKITEGVDYILHQAARRSVAKSVEDPILNNEVNINGTLNVLLAANKNKVKRVVYASSSSVYGDTKKFPQREGDPTNPISPYAVSKLAGEYYCRTFSATFNLSTASLRYFNVFGPRQNPESKYSAVIPAFLFKMLKNEQPPVDWDGLQSRDFTYVDNVVEANLAACRAKKVSGESINIACGESTSVLDIVRALNNALGKNIKPTFAPKRRGDVRCTKADISKMRRLLGIKKEVGFEEGLKKTVEWFKSNLQTLRVK